MDVSFPLSLTALLITVAGAITVGRGVRRIPGLSLYNPRSAMVETPPVSIVVAARDEAETIEPALRSLLALDYPALEIITVNDRSTDATGAILDKTAAGDTRLRVLHIAKLPDGWLGKSHALHRGAELARGEYLLFTDADVHMTPDTVCRAISHVRTDRLDHLVVLPRVIASGALLRALMILTVISLLLMFRPWHTRTRRSCYMGAGAFNLVRRAAYTACGGHRALAMAPVDDIELGRLVKAGGFSQGVAGGDGRVTVEWYPDIGSVVSGLEKNTLAAFDYSVGRLSAATAVALLVALWPPVGLLVTTGTAWWLNLTAVAVVMGLCAGAARAMGWNRRCAVLVPPATLILLYIWWRSTLLTLVRGGIVWRGVFYPLSQLKAARPEKTDYFQ